MSQYVTPFLVLNLGSEMVFVIAQRLNAQNIPTERATFVLNDIISVLLSKELITDIMRPQMPYSHQHVRNIMEDVAQSSIMRLDATSMDKLWDLITMVAKWQISHSQDILKLTLRHLYEVENYVTNPDTQLQLHQVQNLIENFSKLYSQNELGQIREDIIFWLKQFNVKVSLLLKLGLQNMDGSFVMNQTNDITREMLKNLGENIYSVTDNGRILEKKRKESLGNSNEVNLLVDQILGERRPKGSTTGPSKNLKLNIQSQYKSETPRNVSNFQTIEIKQNDSKLNEMFRDLNMNDNANEVNFREDLLEMIGTDV